MGEFLISSKVYFFLNWDKLKYERQRNVIVYNYTSLLICDNQMFPVGDVVA